MICPATCAALGAAIAPRAGKGSGELTLVHGPLVSFEDGDSLLADAMHCNYFLIETLLERDVDLVFEQNGARMTDFTRGLRLDTRDHIVFWPKSARPE